MEITQDAIRLLQRALNALARGTGLRRVAVDGRLGRRTVTALMRFLAMSGAAGEVRLARACQALRRDVGESAHGE